MWEELVKIHFKMMGYAVSPYDQKYTKLQGKAQTVIKGNHHFIVHPILCGKCKLSVF